MTRKANIFRSDDFCEYFGDFVEKMIYAYRVRKLPAETLTRIRNMWKVFNDMRQKKELCDGVIRTDEGVSFAIHRHLLAAVSPFFKVLFLGKFSSSETRQVCLGDVDAKLVGHVLDFIYTGNLHINENNALNLFMVVDRLLIEPAIIRCELFFISKMAPENCIGVYCLSLNFYCPNLKREARKFILRHFPQVYQASREIHMLPAGELKMILSDDNLNSQNEELVFNTALLWLLHSPKERHERWLKDILPYVRFGLCPPRFLRQVVLTNKHILNDTSYKPVIETTLHLLSAWLSAGNMLPIACSNYHFRPRAPQEIVFAVGGWSVGSATNIIETYDIRADRWITSRHGDIYARAYHGLALHDGQIYVIGGFDGNTCYSSVRSFNPETSEWHEKAPMNHVRCFCSVVVLEGFIYAMGGFNGHYRVNTCEIYDSAKNQWSMMTSMKMRRSDASADTLHGRIYIAGGFNGQDVVSSVEMYNPKSKNWVQIASMPSPRSGLCLVNYKFHLYAVGGYDGFNRLSTVERYDYQLNTWVAVPGMKFARSNFATAIIEGRLLAIGGYSGFNTMYSVESYSDRDRRWRRVSDMNFSRSALKCCTITRLSNSFDYSFAGSLRNLTQPFSSRGHGDQGVEEDDDVESTRTVS